MCCIHVFLYSWIHKPRAYTNRVYAQTSHCVHTHITPLAEFTYLTEPFPTEAKAENAQRYSVIFPEAPMVAYCAKGIAGVKVAGALLLDHLMSHQPCHTLHPIHPAHPLTPPSPPPPSLFFVYTHIAICVYTYSMGIYTRRIRVYTKTPFVYTQNLRARVYTKTSFVYTPKHHLCIHQI